MSLGVHGYGDPISIHQGKTVVLSDVNALRKEELERRRKLRLEQVRHQSKEFSNRILQNVQQEKEKNTENEKKEKEALLRQWQVERIKTLERQYQDCLDSVRQSQNEKNQISEEEVRKQKLLQEKENIRKARERGKQAMEKVKLDKMAEDSKKETEQKQKHFSNTIEKLRSTMVTSQEVLKDLTTNSTADSHPLFSYHAEVSGSQNAPQSHSSGHAGKTSGSQTAAQAHSSGQTGKTYDRSLYEENVGPRVSSTVGNEGAGASTRVTAGRNSEAQTQHGTDQANRRTGTQVSPDSTQKEDRSIVQTLEEERRKLMEYKLKLENEERKRHLLEEKLRMETQARLNAQLKEENEQLKREKIEEDMRKREMERKTNAREMLDEIREEECERREKEDDEDERKLEEYRRELKRIKSKEEARSRDMMKVNIITSSRRSKSCTGARQDSCSHSCTDSDESFLSDKTWPPSHLHSPQDSPVATAREKCHKCTSKKIIQPTIPIGKPARAPVKMKPVATHKSSARPVTSLGGVVDRNLRAFEKERLNKDFKKLLSELEHLTREERRIKSRGCLLHDDPLFHMSESRKQAVSRLKQNKMASAFEQLSAGCTSNPLARENIPPFSHNNPLGRENLPQHEHKTHENTQLGGLFNGNFTDKVGISSHLGKFGSAATTTQTREVPNTNEIPEDNTAKLKQLLERVNQKREIIMKQLVNPRIQSRTQNLGDLYNIPEENSGPSLTDKVDSNAHFKDNQGFIGSTGRDLRFDSSEKQGYNEKDFEKVFLQRTQQMVSKEIQVSPREDLSQGAGINLKSAKASRNVQTAFWTRVEHEDDSNENKIDEVDDKTDQGYEIGGNALGHSEQRMSKSSVQRVIMQSEEVQTSLEFTQANQQEAQNTSTWAEDLQARQPSPRRANTIAFKDPLNQPTQGQNTLRVEDVSPFMSSDAQQQHGISNEQFASPNARVRQKICQQSEITTIKAAKNGQNPTAPQDQYVYQVETTSSTTEIEVSSLESVHERSRRKKHRKSTVAFPPSPIAKVKQVRKTLFNDNIEVIVNIKDSLGAVVREDLDGLDGKEVGFGRQGVWNGKNQRQYPADGEKQFDSIENRSYGKCAYYPDEKFCAQNCPCSSRSKWQRCKGRCQSQRCRCVPESEANSTDDTRSSYMSPPRYIKTLHDAEINQLISQHSLHGNYSRGNFLSRGNFVDGENNIREGKILQDVRQGADIPHDPAKPQRGHEENIPERSVHSAKPRGQTQRENEIRNMGSQINDEILELINEKLKHNTQKENFANQDEDEIDKRKSNKERAKEKAKKPVESVAPNDELMNYILTLLNMDKKDIEGIPIEVSDVSIASELFTSTSEENDNEDVNKTHVRPDFRQNDNISVKPNDGLRRTDNSNIKHNDNSNVKPNDNGFSKPARVETTEAPEHIDVNSRRNRNLLAQKYADLVHERAGKICSSLKSEGNHRENPRKTDNFETGRFETYKLGDEPGGGYKPEEFIPVKRPCNRPWEVAVRSTIQGPSTLAESIANAGQKVPYKEIFKSNLRDTCAYEKKLDAPVILNSKEPAHPVPRFDKILEHKLQDKLDGNQRQTNFQPLPNRGSTKQTVSGQFKSKQSPRLCRENKGRSGEQTTSIRGRSPRGKVPSRRHRSKEHNGPKTVMKSQHKADNSTLHQPLNLNISNQTAQSADQSTVYLNIPRRFENVDNVVVEDRRNSLDSDVAGRSQKRGALGPTDFRKWKLVRDICAGKKVSLAERRQVVQDICSGVGAKLREANVSDVQRQLLDEGGRETRLNCSMDLQVPDVCLERPQSQQNSGRKSQSDLNSTKLSTAGWNTVDSLVQELIGRGIIDRPFPWLTNEETSGGLDETNLTEALRRLLESDSGSTSDKTPPLADSTQPPCLQTSIDKRKADPIHRMDHSEGTNKKLQERTIVSVQPASNQGSNGVEGSNGTSNGTSRTNPLNQTSASMRLRKIDLQSIFEEYKKDIEHLLRVMPSPDDGRAKPVFDFNTLLSQDSEQTSPADVENLALDDSSNNTNTRQNTTNTSNGINTNDSNAAASGTELIPQDAGSQSTKESIARQVGNVGQPSDVPTARRSSLNRTDEGIGTSSNRTSQDVGSGQDKGPGQDSGAGRELDRGVIPAQPMTSEEFLRQLKALTDDGHAENTSKSLRTNETDGPPRSNVGRTRNALDLSMNTMGATDTNNLTQQINRESQNIVDSTARNNVRSAKDVSKAGPVEFPPGGNNLGEEAAYQALSAQLSQIVRDNASLNVEWKQLLSSSSSVECSSAEIEKRLARVNQAPSSVNAAPIGVNSSSDEIEQRLASIVHTVDPESGRSSWIGATYKTIRQRQREMLDSSDMTSPEERRPRRKPKRVSPRDLPEDRLQEGDSFAEFKSLNASVGSLEATNEKLSMNYESFLREREIALGNEQSRSSQQSLEHQAHFTQTTPDNPPASTHPNSNRKYTSSTPVKKPGMRPNVPHVTLLDDCFDKSGADRSGLATQPFNLCLCIPCTLCKPRVASCAHGFVCNLCCHGNQPDDVTPETRMNSELSGIIRQNELGSRNETNGDEEFLS